jgi:hypothetical protein
MARIHSHGARPPLPLDVTRIQYIQLWPLATGGGGSYHRVIIRVVLKKVPFLSLRAGLRSKHLNHERPWGLLYWRFIADPCQKHFQCLT